MPQRHRQRPRERLLRHWRRWGPYWVVAFALLAASEMLWRWQTWPVRDLIGTGTGL